MTQQTISYYLESKKNKKLNKKPKKKGFFMIRKEKNIQRLSKVLSNKDKTNENSGRCCSCFETGGLEYQGNSYLP